MKLLGRLRSIFAARSERRRRERLIAQFTANGFAETACPSILSLLPIRFPEIVRMQEVVLFGKGDMQVLILPTLYLPRTRTPHRPRLFALLSTPLDPSLRRISGALRDTRERYSIVDQLAFESYPNLSPLPDHVVFAADDSSARRVMDIVQVQQKSAESGSIVIHNGRLFMQMPT